MAINSATKGARTSPLYTVKGVLILDLEGHRVYAKYYDEALLGDTKRQCTLEKAIHDRCLKAKGTIEAMVCEGLIVLGQSNLDLNFFVVGGLEVNELMLAILLEAFVEVLLEGIRPSSGHQLDRRGLMEHFDAMAVLLDDMVDGGVILNVDIKELSGRFGGKKGPHSPVAILDTRSTPTETPSLSSVFSYARQTFARAILK